MCIQSNAPAVVLTENEFTGITVIIMSGDYESAAANAGKVPNNANRAKTPQRETTRARKRDRVHSELCGDCTAGDNQCRELKRKCVLCHDSTMEASEYLEMERVVSVLQIPRAIIRITPNEVY